MCYEVFSLYIDNIKKQLFNMLANYIQKRNGIMYDFSVATSEKFAWFQFQFCMRHILYNSMVSNAIWEKYVFE
jgi:hypothetical protein